MKVREEAQAVRPCPGGDRPRAGHNVNPRLDNRTKPGHKNQGQTQPWDGQARPPSSAFRGAFPYRHQREDTALGYAGSVLDPSPTARPPGWGNVIHALTSLHFLSGLGFFTASCRCKLLLDAQLRAVQQMDLNTPDLNASKHAKLYKLLPRLVYSMPFE